MVPIPDLGKGVRFRFYSGTTVIGAVIGIVYNMLDGWKVKILVKAVEGEEASRYMRWIGQELRFENPYFVEMSPEYDVAPDPH